MKKLFVFKLLYLFCLNAWSYNCQVDRLEKESRTTISS